MVEEGGQCGYVAQLGREAGLAACHIESWQEKGVLHAQRRRIARLRR